MKRRLQLLAPLALVPALLGTGCAKVQAMAAFKEGNKNYREENFKRAIEDYKRATEKDPGFAEAWFYHGSANQALFRPGKETPENRAYLERAIESYNKALEVIGPQPRNETLRKVRLNTLGALTGIYSDDPYKSFDMAQKYAQELLKEGPDDPKNLYAIANLYEKFDKITLSEQTYQKVQKQTAEQYKQVKANPPPEPAKKEEGAKTAVEEALDGAVKACGALAAFYNKPLWDGRSRFDDAIRVLEECTALKPDDPEGYQKLATFFWDKAYRDPMLNDEQKRVYADKGMAMVEKALQLKPDYFEALIYKGLLYRVKATVEPNPRLRAQYLEQAQALQKQALDLKKMQAEEQPPAATPAPGS